VLVRLSPLWQNTWKNERLIFGSVSEVSVHSQWLHCLRAPGWWGRTPWQAACGMVELLTSWQPGSRETERGRGWGTKDNLQRHVLSHPLPPIRPHLPQCPLPPK
jgi:hypothetical protein